MHVQSEQLNGRNLAARRWTVVDTHACQTVHGGYGYGRVNWRNIAITLIDTCGPWVLSVMAWLRQLSALRVSNTVDSIGHMSSWQAFLAAAVVSVQEWTPHTRV
jgi:hypothetical protein